MEDTTPGVSIKLRRKFFFFVLQKFFILLYIFT